MRRRVVLDGRCLDSTVDGYLSGSGHYIYDDYDGCQRNLKCEFCGIYDLPGYMRKTGRKCVSVLMTQTIPAPFRIHFVKLGRQGILRCQLGLSCFRNLVVI